MKFQYIVGYPNFWTFLFERANDKAIDENISMQLPRGSFSVDNKIIHCTHFVDTLYKFNEMFGTRFVPEKSTFGGQTYFNIASLEDGETYGLQEQKEEAITKVEEEKVIEQENDQDVETVSDVVDATEEKEESTIPDWEWISSLTNTKADKESFDVYAEEVFSIKLKRNMKIDNMRSKFKDLLAAK